MAADLKGRVALVTGANRGIGFALCRRLGQEGMTVVLASRDQSRGEEAAAKLCEEGLNVVARQLDVTDHASVDAAARWLEATYGRLDVLVNNAGIMPNKASVLEATLEDAEAMWQVNALAPWRVCRGFVPLMLQGEWGRIVRLQRGRPLRPHQRRRHRLQGLEGSAERLHEVAGVRTAPERRPRKRGLSRLGGVRHGWSGCVPQSGAGLR